MSALHHKRIVDEFRRTGGTLTGPQVAAVVGFGWRRDLHEMRRAGYLLVEDAAGLWHLDLEELPELDAGRAVDAGPSMSVCERVDGSPGTDPDPQVEGETPPLFETEQPSPPTPYDVEAA